MRFARTPPALFLLSLVALTAQAAEHSVDGEAPADESLPRISGSVGIGAVSTSGNTESQSLNVDIATTVEYAVWRHKVKLTGYQASEEGDDTAERYETSLQSDYRLTERDYLFVRGGYQSDKFGAFDRRASLTGGYGRRVLDRGGKTLDLEAGAGRRVSEPDGTNDRLYENIVRLFGGFEWAFNGHSSFSQTLEVESGEENTESESVSAIRSRLVEDLSLRVSHTVTHNSDVPVGTDKTDTLTSVAVEYAF